MTKLGAAADLLVGFAFKSAGFRDGNVEGVRLLRGDNVQQRYIRWGDKTKKWSADEFDEFERYQLSEDDVVLAMDRPIVGDGLKVAWVTSDDLPALLVQRVCRLRGVPGVSLTRYLRYVLSAAPFAFHVHRITTGANIPHISSRDIAAYQFSLPALGQQALIVERLSPFDALVSNNQRRIALLEESARRVYTEWFVHQRFPGYEVSGLANSSPARCALRPLSDAAEFVNGFAFKPDHHQEIGLPIVKIPELRDGPGAKNPQEFWDRRSSAQSHRFGGCSLLWSGTLLVNEWSDGPALLNQHLFKVVARQPGTKRLVRLAIEAAIPALLGQSVGATMQHIRRSALDEHCVLIPDEDLAREFAAVVDPMLDLVLNLRQQNRHLVAARDALLPRLMSGHMGASNVRLPEEATA